MICDSWKPLFALCAHTSSNVPSTGPCGVTRAVPLALRSSMCDLPESCQEQGGTGHGPACPLRKHDRKELCGLCHRADSGLHHSAEAANASSLGTYSHAPCSLYAKKERLVPIPWITRFRGSRGSFEETGMLGLCDARHSVRTNSAVMRLSVVLMCSTAYLIYFSTERPGGCARQRANEVK